MKRAPLHLLIGYCCYRFPSTGRYFWPAFDRFKQQKYRLLNRISKTYSDKYPTCVVYVDPNNITYCEKIFEFNKSGGKVVSGDWDRGLEKFEDNEVFQCLQKRFLEGYDWDKIEYVQKCLDEVKKGRTVWQNCTTTTEIHEHCADVDELYQSIKKNGILEPIELLDRGENVRPYNIPKINIGRHGELVLNSDGTHRTALGKITGVNKMPVWINVRHKQWQAVRELTANGKKVPPKYKDHPDLRDLTSR